jgi:hypothetical protein
VFTVTFATGEERAVTESADGGPLAFVVERHLQRHMIQRAFAFDFGGQALSCYIGQYNPLLAVVALASNPDLVFNIHGKSRCKSTDASRGSHTMYTNVIGGTLA